MKIKPKEVLLWYDGPYLFTGKNESGKIFLGIKVRLEGDYCYDFLFAETNEKEIEELKQATKSVDSVFSGKVSHMGRFEYSYDEIEVKPYVLNEELDNLFFDGSFYLDKEDYE